MMRRLSKLVKYVWFKFQISVPTNESHVALNTKQPSFPRLKSNPIQRQGRIISLASLSSIKAGDGWMDASVEIRASPINSLLYLFISKLLLPIQKNDIGNKMERENMLHGK